MTLDKPLISVIIPSYNHYKYISLTIDSVLEQTYPNLELIIVDDASNDNTSDVVERYRIKCEEKFKRFEFVKKEKNKGIIDSLNTAISFSSAEFVFIIASDDVIKIDCIEILEKFLSTNPDYASVRGDNDFLDSDNNIIYWDKKQKSVYEISLASYKTFAQYLKTARSDVDFYSDDFGSYVSLLKGNYIPNGSLFRKKCIVDVGGYKEEMLEDWYMHLQIAKKYKIKYIDKVLYSYRWHDSNTIKQRKAAKEIYKKTFINEKEFCYDNGHKELWDELYKDLNKNFIGKLQKEVERFTSRIHNKFFVKI